MAFFIESTVPLSESERRAVCELREIKGYAIRNFSSKELNRRNFLSLSTSVTTGLLITPTLFMSSQRVHAQSPLLLAIFAGVLELLRVLIKPSDRVEGTADLINEFDYYQRGDVIGEVQKLSTRNLVLKDSASIEIPSGRSRVRWKGTDTLPPDEYEAALLTRNDRTPGATFTVEPV